MRIPRWGTRAVLTDRKMGLLAASVNFLIGKLLERADRSPDFAIFLPIVRTRLGWLWPDPSSVRSILRSTCRAT